ncbi:MAG: glycosyltransferase family 4 protein [Planctomycetes bacterium]|nr:glycosyltransferase family 4 protein [Planctomycetota bacterium]
MRLQIAIAAPLLDDRPSGANRRLLSMLRAAADQLEPGESITVLHRPGALPEHLPDGVAWQPLDIDVRSTWRRALAERRKLPRALAALGADVVEIGALPVPPRLPCAVALTLHDLRDLHGLRRFRPAIVVRHVLRTSLRRAAAIAVPSEWTAAELRRAIGEPRAPLFIVPGGVDLRVAALAQDSGPPPLPFPFILHVGHLEPRKNLLMLLSAFAELRGTWTAPAPAPRLVLVGRDLGHRATLEGRAALLGIRPEVVFAGVVDEPALWRLYTAAAAVVVPSRLEGFGQPALEALACGAPTLVADRGALPEVVGTAGEVLPVDDAAAWTAALRRATGHADAADGRTRRREQAARHPWSATAAAQLACWRCAAQQRR